MVASDFRSPSGRTLHIQTADDQPITGMNSSVMFANGQFSKIFALGRPGYHEDAMRDALPSTLRSRHLYKPGYEIAGSWNDHKTANIVALKGPHHEVLSFRGGPPPTDAANTQLFDMFDFEDTPDGMAIRPHKDTLLTMTWEQMTLVIQGRAIITIPDPLSGRALLPATAGSKTRNGEVWRLEFDDADPATSYVFGTPTAICQVTPWPVPGETYELGPWLEPLDLKWSA